MVSLNCIYKNLFTSEFKEKVWQLTVFLTFQQLYKNYFRIEGVLGKPSNIVILFTTSPQFSYTSCFKKIISMNWTFHFCIWKEKNTPLNMNHRISFYIVQSALADWEIKAKGCDPWLSFSRAKTLGGVKWTMLLAPLRGTLANSNSAPKPSCVTPWNTDDVSQAPACTALTPLEAAPMLLEVHMWFSVIRADETLLFSGHRSIS